MTSSPTPSLTLGQTARHYLLPVTGTLLLTVCSIEASQTHGVAAVWWWLGTITSLIALTIRTVYRERQTSLALHTADQITTDLSARLHQHGQALLHALTELTNSTDIHERQALLKSLITQACQSAHDCCGASSSERRSVFYQLIDDTLTRRRYHGRLGSNPPRLDFHAGRSPHDDEALRHANSEDVLAVTDLIKHPPPQFLDAHGRSYRSFIAVPVRAGNRSHGLLAVDADTEDAFDHRDTANLALIASILACALSHCDTFGDSHRRPRLQTFRPTHLAAPDVLCGPL